MCIHKCENVVYIGCSVYNVYTGDMVYVVCDVCVT